ncbi:MAG: DUF2851 family protein [Bacteroidota bacterium]|nr:DUF2851 family protein [Bacteroidota bacterium]
MDEEFLQYIWKCKLFDSTMLTDEDGEKIEILQVGEQNHDAGPDFFNVRIKTGQTVWAGNAEIHVNSSDWAKHGHHTNKAYDNVILHAVYNDDAPTYRTNGERVATVKLKFNSLLVENYQRLLKSDRWASCQNNIQQIDHFTIKSWILSLAIERLEEKTQSIQKSLADNHNNWTESFYHSLARTFGANLNADAFEHLVRILPFKYLAQHKDNLFQVEALLFGQAGLFDDILFGDEYYQALKKEYVFLQKKFGLKPMELHLWKFLRLRPINFPTIRLAQFAALVHQSAGLFSKILYAEDLKEAKNYFRVKTSEYWDTHYVFNKTSTYKKKFLGEGTMTNIVINTLVPFLFVYGKNKGDENFKNKAIEYLEQLKPEKNSIIDHWAKIGISARNAYETQALIQLKNKYCNFKRCLDCQIGNKIIRL